MSNPEGKSQKLTVEVPANPDIIKKYHKTSYPAISPHRPELNQAGKTILVTGASAGIGFAIARGFGEASASRVILTGRRSDVLQTAASKLAHEFRETEFLVRVCDVGSASQTADLWAGLRRDNIFVDVLILNAADLRVLGSLMDSGADKIWPQYETNFRSLLDFTERLYKQEGYEDKQKYVVFITTGVVHLKAPIQAFPAYSLAKINGQILMQRLAGEVDRKKLQVFNMHPGMILSETLLNGGMDEDTLAWDDAPATLPGHFAVWAATSEAAFLHGRFAWAAWDVDELKSGEFRERVDSDPDFLTIGIKGL
ncbi:D-erythrulose reductase [Phlyctema vagabunda]|uniref:D-erythrulose reductase n=1 Tax=Phlyctema vagabunda TaxID=108571 RepID=A0ABR4PBB2_9HELO